MLPWHVPLHVTGPRTSVALPRCSPWNARLDALFLEGIPKPVSLNSSVANQLPKIPHLTRRLEAMRCALR